MVYHGRVKNGVIVLDGDSRLPEGAEVCIHPVAESEQLHSNGNVAPLFEGLKPFIGSLADAPSDLAENHDHYLYGVPKRP